MPKTRVVQTVYGVGGYDPTKPNNNIIEQITQEISDEQLAEEQLEREVNEIHPKVLLAINHWDQVTLAQKDELLRVLAKFYLVAGQRLGLFNIA